jgi:hypothetical protein
MLRSAGSGEIGAPRLKVVVEKLNILCVVPLAPISYQDRRRSYIIGKLPSYILRLFFVLMKTRQLISKSQTPDPESQG